VAAIISAPPIPPSTAPIPTSAIARIMQMVQSAEFDPRRDGSAFLRSRRVVDSPTVAGELISATVGTTVVGFWPDCNDWPSMYEVQDEPSQ
jgi:hypothetical protein